MAEVVNDQAFFQSNSWSFTNISTQVYSIEPQQRVKLMHYYITGTLHELERNWQQYAERHNSHIVNLKNKLVIYTFEWYINHLA